MCNNELSLGGVVSAATCILLCIATVGSLVLLLLCTFNFLHVCLLQHARGLQKVGKLLDILLMRDDHLVPVFLKALHESDQPHVVDMLTHKGLHTFGLLLIIHCVGIVCHHN